MDNYLKLCQESRNSIYMYIIQYLESVAGFLLYPTVSALCPCLYRLRSPAFFLVPEWMQPGQFSFPANIFQILRPTLRLVVFIYIQFMGWNIYFLRQIPVYIQFYTCKAYPFKCSCIYIPDRRLRVKRCFSAELGCMTDHL